MKQCTKCERELPEASFHTDGSKGDGLYSQCRDCVAAKRRKHRAKVTIKERDKVRSREYYIKNKERILARLADPEVRERRNALNREYSKKPEVRAQKKAYRREYKKRPEEIERRKAYKARPDVRARRNRARVKRLNAVRAKAIEYLGGKCSNCKKSFECHSVYDVHHTGPKVKGREISRLYKWGWETIKAELDKGCVLLCANCHRQLHSNLRFFNGA